MKQITILLAACLFYAVPCFGADTNFFFGVNPFAGLSSQHADEFTASRISEPTQKEEISIGNILPNIKVGMGIGGAEGIIDFGLGGGRLNNNTLSSTFASFDITPRFKLSESVAFGPHLAYLYFTPPDWDGSAQIDISGNSGFMSGLALTFGKKSGFSLSLDYIDAEFDVKARQNSDWQISGDKIDMSGMAVQLGVSGDF